MSRLAVLMIGSGLAIAPAMSGRRANRQHREWLNAACEQANHVEHQIPLGVLDDAAGQPGPPNTIGVRLLGERVEIEGMPVQDADVGARLASLAATASPAAIVWFVPANQPSGEWLTTLQLARSAVDGIPWFAAVEHAHPTGAPAPDLVGELHRARAALGANLPRRFDRLVAEEGLGPRLALPTSSCALLDGLIRTPVRPAHGCAQQVDETLNVLSGCGLDPTDTARAVTIIGEAWRPTDRAQVWLRPLSATAQWPQSHRTWAEWIRGQSAVDQDK